MKTWTVLSATAFLLCAFQVSTTSARTWYILPDGTGDAPTIQAGIDSAIAGDIVEAACGTYYEHNLFMKSGITLISETGQADCVIVDAQQQGRGILCVNVDNSTSIEGITVTGGVTTGSEFPDYFGGGMICHNSSPFIVNCVFAGNVAFGEGGAVACVGETSPTFNGCNFMNNAVYGNGSGGGVVCWAAADATFVYCVFEGNSSSIGGGLFCWSANADLVNCTVTGNVASTGGGIAIANGSSFFTYNTEILNNDAALGADGAIGYDCLAVLTCSDVDLATFWVEGGTLILDNDDCDGVIGTEAVTWGGVKVLFR